MTINPFASSEALLQTPLSDEACQRIDVLVFHKALQGYLPSAVPEHFHLERLRQQVARNGPNVYIRHPADIAVVYAGVTLAVYQAIETLYCSRIGRSISMVWRILAAMAASVGVPPVEYEAVWALCISLEAQRHASIDVSIERGQECWYVGTTTLDLIWQERDGSERKHPSVLCVVDLARRCLLSYQLASQDDTQQQQMSLAFYTAVCSLRRPHQQAPTGVLWHLPKQLITEALLPSESLTACRRLGIPVNTEASQHPFLQTLQTIWASELAGRTLSHDHSMRLLDRSLEKTFGNGPLHVQAQHDQVYAHLSGYSQEPEWLFPLLRVFLPERSSMITSEGMIEIDDLHYADDLLQYFVGRSVTVRRPKGADAHLWVYLEQDILCQAKAHELRRHDGTYRRSRPRR